MAYLYQAVEGQAQVALALKDPFAARFPADVVVTADRLEILCSSFDDPGEDWTEFRLFAQDREIARQRVPGY